MLGAKDQRGIRPPRDVAISDGPLTRPLMNLYSAIPVLTVMNFHRGLLGVAQSRQLKGRIVNMGNGVVN
jgi:hypothetical protein